uniref:Putative ABC transporter n=1 Tax=Davidia involucrata TaxID=16924 RepID=A0A5B7C9H5_DAVIN
MVHVYIYCRVGIEIPKIEVRFEHLSVEGDVYVGSRALPTLFNATLNTIEVLYSMMECSNSFLILSHFLEALQLMEKKFVAQDLHLPLDNGRWMILCICSCVIVLCRGDPNKIYVKYCPFLLHILYAYYYSLAIISILEGNSW